jgi:hypothetical protein
VYGAARAGNLTIRQLAERVTDDAGTLVGTAVDFAVLVIPELRRSGLFRTSYAGRTLRSHLGLPRPASRYASHRN